LGEVNDPTEYYLFQGQNIFLEHGLIQYGTAITTDNEKGFSMMRFFTNSMEEMNQLEKECGLRTI